MIVPGEEMGVGLWFPDRRKGKSLCLMPGSCFLRLGNVDSTLAKTRRQPDHWPFIVVHSGRPTSNLVLRKAEGKVKVTHLLTSQSLIQHA